MLTGCLLLTAVNVHAGNTLKQITRNGKLRVGCHSGNIPFIMKDKNNQFTGFEIELAKKMADKMGVRFIFVHMPFNELIPALQAGKIDIIISGLKITPKCNLQINFVGPYFRSGKAILLAKKHKQQIKYYLDLNDPKYVILSCYNTNDKTIIKEKLPKARYKAVKNALAAGIKIKNGEADAFVADLATLIQLKRKLRSNKIFLLKKPFTYEPFGFAIRQGDTNFLNWLKNFLAQVRAEGYLHQLYNKWIKSEHWYEAIP